MISWFKTLFKIVREYEAIVESFQRINTVQGDVNITLCNRHNNAENRILNIEDAVIIANNAHKTADEAVKFIKDRTEVAAEVNIDSNRPNTVIFIGRYKGRDYVEVFNVEDAFEMIRVLRDAQKYHHRKILDGPPGFKAFVNTELGG